MGAPRIHVPMTPVLLGTILKEVKQLLGNTIVVWSRVCTDVCPCVFSKALCSIVYALLCLGQQGSWLNSCPSMQKVLTVLLQEEEWLHYKKYTTPYVLVRAQTARWHAVESFNPVSAPHELTQFNHVFGRYTHLKLFLEKEQDGGTSKTANASSASPKLVEKWEWKTSNGRMCA